MSFDNEILYGRDDDMDEDGEVGAYGEEDELEDEGYEEEEITLKL